MELAFFINKVSDEDDSSPEIDSDSFSVEVDISSSDVEKLESRFHFKWVFKLNVCFVFCKKKKIQIIKKKWV